VAAVRPDPPDRPGRTRPGHQSWCRSARSSGSRRASRAWSTSPSWPTATWRSPSRSCRSATRSSSRSSTSTWTGARISLSLKQANEGTVGRGRRRRLRPDPVRHARLVRRPGQLRVPRGLSTRRPASGCRLRAAARGVGATSTPEARARFEAHRRQVEESRAKAEEEDRAGGRGRDGFGGQRRPAWRPLRRPPRPARGGTPGAVTSSSSPGPRPPAPWPPTRPWRPCARSCQAARTRN